MKLLFFFFLLSFSCSIVFAQNKTYWSPEQTLKMKNITAVRVSPDGKKVAYSIREAIMTDDRSEYINQIFLSSADGSTTIQFTKAKRTITTPNGARMVNGLLSPAAAMGKTIFTYCR